MCPVVGGPRPGYAFGRVLAGRFWLEFTTTKKTKDDGRKERQRDAAENERTACMQLVSGR